MDWSDHAFVLSSRKHGETSAIVTLMTRDRGVHAGLVRGGFSKRKRGDLQPGNLVSAHWRGRLAEHLGSYTCELIHAYGATLLDEAGPLAALSAALAVTERALPERESHRAVFDGLSVLLGALEGEDWPSVYVKWELGLLGELGFGLDLESCAATGSNDHLAYVSPKSGRAVSVAAAEPYMKSLLALPPFLLDSGVAGSPRDIIDGLTLTGYFLDRHVFGHCGSGNAPPARHRLFERLRRLITKT
jgi:DNA repair protein RecO (recombination protein O)